MGLQKYAHTIALCAILFPMNVNEAVRQLRKLRQQTQQQFATELGMSISGLQNYERDQMPEPRQLAIFLECTRKADNLKLMQAFAEALSKSLAIPYSSLFYPRVLPADSSARVEYSFNLKSLEALRRCLSGHADYADVAPLVVREVAEAIERLVEQERDPERVKQLRAIRPQRRGKEK